MYLLLVLGWTGSTWRPGLVHPVATLHPRHSGASSAEGGGFSLETARATAAKSRVAAGLLPKRKGKAKRSERIAPASGNGFGVKGTGLKYVRTPKASRPCACGAGEAYAQCCASAHESGEVSSDVVSLLRARYAAFVYRNPDFLISTTHRESSEWRADMAEWRRELLSFCDRFKFEGLRVDSEPTVDEAAGEAELRFTVSLVEKGSIKMFDATELARFVREDGRWLYASGDVSYSSPP